LRRGEIWTASGGAAYLGKPKPAVIIQDDRFDATASITICALTSGETLAPTARILIEPSETNGLRLPSILMVDKIATVPKTHLGRKQDIIRLNRAISVFLGLAAA
jgi:mRNA interferase MazF